MKEQNITVSIAVTDAEYTMPHNALFTRDHQVALRVRPINSREVRAGAKPIARAVDQNVSHTHNAYTHASY